MRWLVDADQVRLPEPMTSTPSSLPRVAPGPELDPAVVVADCGEPLDPVEGRLPVLRVYAWLGFAALPERVLLRRSVLARLEAAHAALPAGFGLVVLDGWRSTAFQRELLAHYRATGDVTGFVADPDDPRNPAPHTTGGAVDLTLLWRDAALGLGTDYDAFEARAAVDALEADPAAAGSNALALRRLLAAVLTAEGFVAHPGEWWHWSYGDNRWASATAERRSLYATVDAPASTGGGAVPRSQP